MGYTTHRHNQDHDVSNNLVAHDIRTTTAPDDGNNVQRVSNEVITNMVRTNTDAHGSNRRDQLCNILWASWTIHRSMAETNPIVLTFYTTAITTAEATTQMDEVYPEPTNPEDNHNLVPQRINNCYWRYTRAHDKHVHQRQFDSDSKTLHDLLSCHYESEEPIATRKGARAIISEADDEAHKLPKFNGEAKTHP
ncbi:hypothetical protein MKW92_044065 [Papaver armeniacum]|nr:hypothetical protein MKW92_044065 [Papaver armeniacum]